MHIYYKSIPNYTFVDSHRDSRINSYYLVASFSPVVGRAISKIKREPAGRQVLHNTLGHLCKPHNPDDRSTVSDFLFFFHFSAIVRLIDVRRSIDRLVTAIEKFLHWENITSLNYKDWMIKWIIKNHIMKCILSTFALRCDPLILL